jgi:hypothetical protein
MKPERAIAACLSALAAGLVALLLFGPTEGAEAKEESQEATTTAPEPQTTAEIETEPVTTTETEPVTTTEPEPVTTTEPEPEPPAFLPGDGTFSEPVTITLAFQSEVESRRHQLPRQVSEVRIEARATSLRGQAGDVHGVECTLDRRTTYTFFVDLWGETVMLERTKIKTTEYLQGGEAPGLLAPTQPNVLSLTCESRRQGTMLSLRVNGEPVTAFLDRGSSGRFSAVSLAAWSPAGDHEVVFDGVVVETGGS